MTLSAAEEKDLFRMVTAIYHHLGLDGHKVVTEDDDMELRSFTPKKNKQSPLRNTPHDKTIQRLIDSDGTIRRGSMAYYLRKIFDIDPIGLHDVLGDRRPDAFKICNNDFCQALTIYEIEHTSFLSSDKLSKYALLWDFMCGYDVEVMVGTGNIHGTKIEYFDMMKAYWDMTRKVVEKHREDTQCQTPVG